MRVSTLFSELMNRTCNTLRSGALFGGLIAWLAVAGMLPLSGHAAEIVAHRGASHDAPENTLASVKLAWKQQADAVEIDVYLSKDQRIVLMHDKTAKRTTGVDRPIAEMVWDEIQKLDAGAWKGKQYRGTRVPLLSEVLQTIPAGKRLFIEVKCGPEIVPVLKRVLEKSDCAPEQTAIICFNEDVIERAVNELPQIQSYWLESLYNKKTKQPIPVEKIIETAHRIGARGVDLGSQTEFLDQEFLSKLEQAGLPCYAWTVNDPKEAGRLARLGVLGITTDQPALLRKNGIAKIE